MDPSYSPWGLEPMEFLTDQNGLPTIQETEWELDQQVDEPLNSFLPLDPCYAPQAQMEGMPPQGTHQMSNLVQEIEKIRLVNEEIRDMVKRQSELQVTTEKKLEKLLLDISKDITGLQRYLNQLMPWCLHVHQSISEIEKILEKKGKIVPVPKASKPSSA